MPESDYVRLVNFKEMPECGGVWGVPAIYKGSVYFGAADTWFYSVDAKTGRKNWAYKTNGIVLSSAAAKDDILYFGCFDQNLYALGTDGRLRWKFRTGGLIASGPSIHKDTIYFGSSDYNLYAVDLKTHRELWRFRANDEIIGDPLVYNNRLYFGSMDSYFYCLDLDGNLIWKFKTADSITLGRPAVSDGLIYFSSGDHVLYALTLEGNVAWKFYTGGIMYDWPHIYGDIVLVGNRERYVYCLDKKTGICRWKFMCGIWAPRAVAFRDRVYVSAEHIFCLDANGYKLWEYDAGLTNAEGMVVNDDGCFFGCGLDAKSGLLSHDGQLVREFMTNGAISSASMFAGVIPPPKWNPNLLSEGGMTATVFNPYTLLNKGGILEKYMEAGTDTTERYGELGESLGAYREAEKGGSAGAYRQAGESGGKKKKDILEELLQMQREEDKRRGM